MPQSRCGAWLRWANETNGLIFDLIMVRSEMSDPANHLLDLLARLDVFGPTDTWDTGEAALE
jgi:hypothetical protein